MKVYKVVDHIAFDHISDGSMELSNTVADVIERNQAKGYQSEVQYSTCATHNTIVYSALILGYTEE